jgi:hypothetical protein
MLQESGFWEALNYLIEVRIDFGANFIYG